MGRKYRGRFGSITKRFTACQESLRLKIKTKAWCAWERLFVLVERSRLFLKKPLLMLLASIARTWGKLSVGNAM